MYPQWPKPTTATSIRGAKVDTASAQMEDWSHLAKRCLQPQLRIHKMHTPQHRWPEWGQELNEKAGKTWTVHKRKLTNQTGRRML